MSPAAALEYLASLGQFGMQPGLETTRRLCAAAGNPESGLRFIHVAGTNGKGSVCAFLDCVYRTAGYRVGLYTSPHLVRFGERIRINGAPLSNEALAGSVAAFREIAGRCPGPSPTLFEAATVMALREFAAASVDVAIWETGLGGRLDATNVVMPLATVVTNVGLDHQHILGSTLDRIAAEKAGIFKPGVPALTAAEDPDARAVLEYRARELDAPFLAVGAPEAAALTVAPGLRGAHQRLNAALAAATIRMLRVWLPVGDDALREGLASTRWPGRLQEIRRGSQILVLDGAHNLPAVLAVKAALTEVLPGVRPTVIVGMLADKDWRSMIRELTPLAGRLITVPVDSHRSVSPGELKAAVIATGMGRPVRAATSLDEALRWAVSDPAVLLTGSLYLIGEALERLEATGSVPAGERSLNEWTPPGIVSTIRSRSTPTG
ncbi:MAG: bifunctional folylpolyglutamate synthase/dihydrofolate synthase [Verrucomicrobiae bacterium]|nr:bifunctional folylpolyglutamate synthase/dihydrofolate synthase [Verrucomicrobiae bacterium]